jgi:predicted lactoylglutathione lyase
LWAILVASKHEVDATLASAVVAGATFISPVRERDEKLYSSYFTDPEGSGWQVVWTPHMTVGQDGSPDLIQA